MKFQYNYLENTLTGLEENHSVQITEHFYLPQGAYGTDGFHLGENHHLTFTLAETKIQVCYQTPSQAYHKELPLPANYEITFAFTPEDLLKST